MSQPITLKDIASRAGVSVATVSLALRNHPRITGATKDHIKNIAEKMGYRPNAVFSLFSSYRKAGESSKFQSTLGWIDCWKETGALFRRYKSARGYFDGAWRRAEELGFHLEVFRLHAEEMSGKRLSSILYSRGIQGLLIPPMPTVGASLELDWKRFSAVTFNNSLGWPNLHRVSFSSITASLLALVKLWDVGYRRIAYCPKSVANPFGLIDMGFLGGYLSMHSHLKDLTSLPPFDACLAQGLSQEERKKAFLSWIDTVKPDALLCQDFPQALEWLNESGYHIPKDLGYADTWITGYEQPVAGVDPRPETMGSQAVDFLIELIRRHETGIPENPAHLITHSAWVNGPTTRKHPRSVGSRRKVHIEEELSRLIQPQNDSPASPR